MAILLHLAPHLRIMYAVFQGKPAWTCHLRDLLNNFLSLRSLRPVMAELHSLSVAISASPDVKMARCSMRLPSLKMLSLRYCGHQPYEQLARLDDPVMLALKPVHLELRGAVKPELLYDICRSGRALRLVTIVSGLWPAEQVNSTGPSMRDSLFGHRDTLESVEWHGWDPDFCYWHLIGSFVDFEN